MVVCGACGAQCPDGFRFCGQCGAPLQPTPTATVQERKVVSVLFCDVVGFTAMSEGADPEDVHAVMRRYFAAVRGQIEAHGGVVEKFIGDAVVGVFGVPAAHEDDPERAVRAGLRIVEAVEGLRRPDGLPVQVRVGVNTGEALVRLDVTSGSGEGFLTGDAVNTAARIQSVAPVMGVAVGRTTYEATRPVFDYRELEPATVKGKSEPVAVWRAIAPLARFGTDITRRHDSPLVGREIDLALLKGIFDKMVAASSPQLVTIVGEPGLGKSRLVTELFSYIDAGPTLVTFRQGRCLPYGEGITYWAVGEIVKAHAGILDTDAADVALAKLDAVLPEIEERAWMRQRMLPLIGMEASSPAEQSELFTAWRRFLEAIAEAGPTVVVFEDLHWADPTLLAFLEHLAADAEGVPLLIVATTRPELFDHHPDYGRGLRNATTISLIPLTDDETARLVAALLETLAVPDDLRGPLVERAGGNPLFAEEYVRLVADHDLIERVDDQVRLRHDAQLPLPESVQALIAARLDTLPADHKALLADAAVVGKVFWVGAVATMSDRPESEVVEVMRELSRKEFLRSVRSSTMAGQQEYTFWHVLTRDVAYAQLPRASRARRHLAAAEWIKTHAGNRVEDVADVLAHHCATAMDLALAADQTDLAERARPLAVHYLTVAGEHNLGLDTSAAVRRLAQALHLMPAEDADRAKVLALLGEAQLHAGQLEEAQGALEQALGLFRTAGDRPNAAHAWNLLGIVYERRHDPRWTVLPERAWEMLEELPPGPAHVRALTELAAINMLLNHHEDAIGYADRALSLADQLGGGPAARALGFRGGSRCMLGDAGGLADFQEALTLAADAGLGREVAVLHLNYAGATELLLGPAAGLEGLRAGLAYARPRGLHDAADMMAAARLEALIDVGRPNEAIAEGSALLGSLEESGNVRTLLFARGALLRALAQEGRAVEALPWLEWLAMTGGTSGSPEGNACGLGAAALAHASLGHVTDAVALFVELQNRPSVASGPLIARYLPSWVRCLLALDKPVIADALTSALSPDYPYAQHALDTARAALTEAAGDHRSALTGYTDAARRWHDFTVVTEEAFALLGQGRCLLGLHRANEAARVLNQARDTFAAIGAQPALSETEALLAAATT